MLSVGVEMLSRALLVVLFLPFSALDKLMNFPLAVNQAGSIFPNRSVSKLLIVTGFGVEVAMSAGVLTGIADRLAAFVLALYCIATALLWKRFWAAADFRLTGPSHGRDTFWDFLKNLGLAGGFLLLAFDGHAAGVRTFFANPLASSQPYRMADVDP